MNNLGMGAMIHMLGGGSPESADKYYGRKIKSSTFGADMFLITFDDGVTIKITDDGQSCCESRYMTCDDDPSFLNGKTLTGITVKETNDDGDDCHEIAFLEVQTDQGSITFATHNEHNGYYGGFGLSIAEIQDIEIL